MYIQGMGPAEHVRNQENKAPSSAIANVPLPEPQTFEGSLFGRGGHAPSCKKTAAFAAGFDFSNGAIE